MPDDIGGGEVVAEVIDLSDDTDTLDDGNSQPVSPIGAAFMLNESGVEANNNQITPRPRSMHDTIDLTESPNISSLASSREPLAASHAPLFTPPVHPSPPLRVQSAWSPSTLSPEKVYQSK